MKESQVSSRKEYLKLGLKRSSHKPSLHRWAQNALVHCLTCWTCTLISSLICLLQQINEKPSVINEYESGKAIPNPQVLSKMSKVLGVQLSAKVAKKKTQE